MSEEMFKGRTFDDFLLNPQFSIVESRREVDLKMPLTFGLVEPRLWLNLPIVGANMDTVTGPEMAKSLALEGGIGFLHRNCSIDEQVKWVRYVKTRHAYIIENPLVISRFARMWEAIKLIKDHRVSGLLVEENPGSGILAGLLTNRDIPWDGNFDTNDLVEGWMSPVQRMITAPEDITVEKARNILVNRRIEKLPLVDSSGKIKGLITKKDLRLYAQKPHSNKDEKGRLIVGATVGANKDFMERAEALIAAEADCILMDVAHAHSVVVEKSLKQFRKKFKEVNLVCGNVATFQGARFLAELGADAIKVGIGPGRGCRTRLATSAGVGQLQAIREAFCATAAGRTPIIADGGIKDHKDIFLAIACGASAVMLGSMLSGTDEAPGDIIRDPATKQKKKLYRGMTSPQAVVSNTGEENVDDALETPPEGQSMEVPYRGSVVDVLKEIRGHLQSAVSYAGESTLLEAREKIARNPEKYLTVISKATQRESFER